MNKIVLTLIIVFLSISIFSQDQTKDFSELAFFQDTLGVSVVSSGGDVTVFQDARLEQLMYNYSKAYKRKQQKVFRVQIYFGSGRSGRSRAQNIKNDFETNHPGIPVVITFEEPYFKVKVGDFDKKIDAERLKMQLIEDYSQIFIVEDND